MKSRSLISIIVIGGIMLLTLAFIGKAADKPDQPSNANNVFAGKFVEISTKGSGGGYLSDVHIRSIEGRQFISGKGIGVSTRWKSYEGKEMSYSWDSVVAFNTFDSAEELIKATQ